uniref:Uncharacterized protein n=1 Tax=White spot syndrome virus TaxID=92652 RepID=A4UQM6_WSSV|nr:unknown [White spot syndrome virus]
MCLQTLVKCCCFFIYSALNFPSVALHFIIEYSLSVGFNMSSIQIYPSHGSSCSI